LAIRFAIEGDLRFISHHDSLRLFERALARTGLPVRHSAGFNPRPRISLSLPRSVGVASQDETLVVELSDRLEPSEVLGRLAAEMPAGIRLLAAEALSDRDRRLPRETEYVLPVPPALHEALASKAKQFMQSRQVIVERVTPNSARKPIDIRAYVTHLEVGRHELRWRQSITPTGTVRAAEVLEALGLDVRDHLHRLRRTRVAYEA